MLLDAKRIGKLEGLALEAQAILNTRYSDFRGRNTNFGYFNLYLKEGTFKDRKRYEKWYGKVMKILTRDIKNGLYTAKFSRNKYASGYTLLGADGYYQGLKVLEKIADEARAIYFSDKQIRSMSAEGLMAVYCYREPNLYIVFNSEDYLVHRFRRGNPKVVLEFALKQPSLSAKLSDFRNGGLAGIIVKERFDTMFRQFTQENAYKVGLIEKFITVTPTKIKLNQMPFSITAKQAQKIHDQFGKSE
jgi:hypothetical protein